MALKPSLCLLLTKQLFLRYGCVCTHTCFPRTLPCLSPSWLWRNHLPFRRRRLPGLSARVLARGSQRGQRLSRAQSALPRPEEQKHGGTNSRNDFNPDSARRRHTTPPRAKRRELHPAPASPHRSQQRSRPEPRDCRDLRPPRDYSSQRPPRAARAGWESRRVFIGEAPPRRASGGVTLASLPSAG